jgi:hypothetical protein
MSASNEQTAVDERRAGFAWRRVVIALVVLVAVLVTLRLAWERLNKSTAQGK